MTAAATPTMVAETSGACRISANSQTTESCTTMPTAPTKLKRRKRSIPVKECAERSGTGSDEPAPVCHEVLRQPAAIQNPQHDLRHRSALDDAIRREVVHGAHAVRELNRE